MAVMEEAAVAAVLELFAAAEAACRELDAAVHSIVAGDAPHAAYAEMQRQLASLAAVEAQACGRTVPSLTPIASATSIYLGVYVYAVRLDVHFEDPHGCMHLLQQLKEYDCKPWLAQGYMALLQMKAGNEKKALEGLEAVVRRGDGAAEVFGLAAFAGLRCGAEQGRVVGWAEQARELAAAMVDSQMGYRACTGRRVLLLAYLVLGDANIDANTNYDNAYSLNSEIAARYSTHCRDASGSALDELLTACIPAFTPSFDTLDFPPLPSPIRPRTSAPLQLAASIFASSTPTGTVAWLSHLRHHPVYIPVLESHSQTPSQESTGGEVPVARPQEQRPKERGKDTAASSPRKGRGVSSPKMGREAPSPRKCKEVFSPRKGLNTGKVVVRSGVEWCCVLALAGVIARVAGHLSLGRRRSRARVRERWRAQQAKAQLHGWGTQKPHATFGRIGNHTLPQAQRRPLAPAQRRVFLPTAPDRIHQLYMSEVRAMLNHAATAP